MGLIRKRLKNGMQVILLPDIDAEGVGEVLTVRAGMRYETGPGMKHASHLLEHILFRASTTSAEKIWNKAIAKGAIINASTDIEPVSFWVAVAKEGLQHSHLIFRQNVFRPSFKPNVISVEQGRIVAEERERFHNVPDYVQGVLWPKLLYGGPPLHVEQSLEGHEASICGLMQGQLIDYWERAFVPSNCALVLAGEIPHPKKVLRDIENCFGDLKNVPARLAKGPIKTKQTEPAILIEKRNIKQPYIHCGVRLPNLTHEERLTLEVIAALLCGHDTARLQSELMWQQGWVYAIDNACDPIEQFSDTGSFSICAGVRRERMEDAIRVILHHFKKIASEKVGLSELRRAKAFIWHAEDVTYPPPNEFVALDIAEDWALSGRASDPKKDLRAMMKVTSHDILRVAKKVFREDQLNLVAVGPTVNENNLRKLLKL